MSQQKGKAQTGGLPDISSAQYGSASSKKASKPAVPASDKNKPATAGSPRKHTAPSRPPVTAPKKPSTSGDAPITIKKTTKVPSAPSNKPKTNSRDELAAKRREEERIRLEKERRKKLAKKERKRKSEKVITFFKLLFKGTGAYIANMAVGILLALIVGLLISFIYYRSVTAYNSDITKTYYAFYSYIDPEDETKAAEDRRKAREENNESAKVSFRKKHIVLNDVAYLPMSSLTQFFGLSMSGDDTVRTVNLNDTLDTHGDPDSAVFTSGSKTIEVNGAIHTLSNAPIFRNGDVYVPFEFFEKYVVGISFKTTKKGSKTTIGVTLEQPRISFIGSPDRIINTPNIKDYITEAETTYTYGFDLTPYEQYINPVDPDKYLTLINVDNRLSEDYEPDDLTDVIFTRGDRATQRMRLDAAKSLEAMLKAAGLEGINDVTVTSGYRAYSYQQQLFNQRLNEKLASGKYATREEAEIETAKLTMYPGASEHQSGLCADMHNLPSAMQSFERQAAYDWLLKHCADFGFILRYPKNKTEITGIDFEPWHYRFVGRFHAQLIMESGLCLEEYIELYNSSVKE